MPTISLGLDITRKNVDRGEEPLASPPKSKHLLCCATKLISQNKTIGTGSCPRMVGTLTAACHSLTRPKVAFSCVLIRQLFPELGERTCHFIQPSSRGRQMPLDRATGHSLLLCSGEGTISHIPLAASAFFSGIRAKHSYPWELAQEEILFIGCTISKSQLGELGERSGGMESPCSLHPQLHLTKDLCLHFSADETQRLGQRHRMSLS